jgi:hypothetical protein
VNDSHTGLYHSISSQWKENFTELFLKLVAREETKWPKLNFTVFLSLTIELLRCTHKFPASCTESGITRNIGGCLEDLTSVVTDRCGNAITLKKLLKVYSTFVDLHAESVESDLVKQLEGCLLTLFSCPGLLGAVSEVLRKFESSDVLEVGSADSGLNSLVMRKMVLLLMKYAGLMKRKG